jgi:hypothetical protein
LKKERRRERGERRDEKREMRKEKNRIGSLEKDSPISPFCDFGFKTFAGSFQKEETVQKSVSLSFFSNL